MGGGIDQFTQLVIGGLGQASPTQRADLRQRRGAATARSDATFTARGE
jgi:hypothetical protein